MNSLVKKLLRCWEILERYRLDFTKQSAAYKRPPAGAPVVEIPHVLRLEEECRNFLYEGKSFVRDLLKVFNLLYGTTFVEASEYLWAAKKGKMKQSLITFAERTFGAGDPKTKFLRELSPTVERVVTYRNAAEHEGGWSGTLRIMNFELQPRGKITEPGWWIEKDGKATPKTSIRGDLCGILENLLVLAEDTFVSWAAEHLLVPQYMQVYLVPEDERDATQPVKYVVNASAALEQLIGKAEAERQRG